MSSTTLNPHAAREAVLTLKFLAVDAVEKANSGHPGMPMGAADMAFVLWSRFLRFDPEAPEWADRDRFVLSAGHGCMLLYGLLHLAGFDLSLDDLRAFRQWGSRTPGHPEFGHTAGVEATTGPLGQGVGNAVGMALAARMLAARVNRLDGGFDPIAHRVFALASDGDLMEGISGEASSLAGHLGLGNLVVLYDDNRITIEGPTSLAWSEDVGGRYESYGWHVANVDGHDHEAVAGAIEDALADGTRPSLIRCRTHIAHGAPNKQDTAGSHGAPLGEDETRAAKVAAGWPPDRTFHVPDEVRELFAAVAARGRSTRAAWESGFERWRGAHPDAAATWEAVRRRDVPSGLAADLIKTAPEGKAATRAHGGAVLQAAAERLPGLVGGSADLGPSNNSVIKGSPWVAAGAFAGRNLHFGIREHAMGAVANGMLYHGSFRPYTATFLVFSDYMRPSIRLAALAGLPAIYVFTHDSFWVGEDGPTHQPIEHVAALRLIPNLEVWRPADGRETAAAWGAALERTDGPSALILTRQGLPEVAPSGVDATTFLRGGYRIAGDGPPDAVVLATGSEVHLALGAREALAERGHEVHVVSVPCVERFEAQDASYRDEIVPVGVRVATVEAGRTTAWRAVAGRGGLTIGMDRFGASAPGEVLAGKFGFTVEAVTARLGRWLDGDA